MLRALFCSIPVLVFAAGALPAADEKPEKKDDAKGVTGVVVKVDAKDHAILLVVKDVAGVERQKMFTFGDDLRVTDESGKVLDLKQVIPDEEVTILNKNGRLTELRRRGRKEGDHAKDSDHAKGSDRVFNVDRFFERFDKNKNGTIERDELPERLRHAFDQVDTNKDGKLSREEVEKNFVYLQRQRRPADLIHTLVEMSEADEASMQELEYIYDLLRKMDKNNNGKLDAGEVKAMRQQIVADRVDELMKDLDVNNDGKISKDEARGRIKEDFDKIDLNKDGFIDHDELLKAATQRLTPDAKPGDKKDESSKPKKPILKP